MLGAARANKWKQIISWPHYANESMWGGKRGGGWGRHGSGWVPQGGGNEANECRAVINAGLGPTRAPLPPSLLSSSPLSMHLDSMPPSSFSRGHEENRELRPPFVFRGREGGESCVNRVFQSGGNRNWKLKNARSMLGSWLRRCGDAWRGIRLEGRLESPVS